jgi:hypothetical protein
MTFGTMIDTAIGLTFIYLMLSLLAASITELIASVLNLRGKNLMRGIHSMLTGDFKTPGAATDPLVRKIVEHPLVQPVHLNMKGMLGSTYPSYVPGPQFAAAVLDVLRDGRIAGTMASEAAIGVQALPDGPARTALAAIVAEAGGDIERLRSGLERWFDQSMERVSGIYQRWTQVRLLAIGLATAVLFNVDTVTVAGALSTNEALRASVVKAAESVAAAGETAALQQTYEQAKAALDKLGLPIGWPPAADAAGQAGPWPQMLVGWLVTALAVSLGAPFWFNLMTRLLNLRHAGAKPPAAEDVVPGGRR